MIEKYFEICKLIDGAQESLMSRLEKIQKIIQDPNFKYQKEACPQIMTGTLASSSYWLRLDFFDESCLCQKKPKDEIQQLHLKLLDIGCALIDKGFPLEYHSEKYKERGPDQLGPYVKAFVEQCHKRHAFLHGKIAHRKRTATNPISPKTLA